MANMLSRRSFCGRSSLIGATAVMPAAWMSQSLFAVGGSGQGRGNRSSSSVCKVTKEVYVPSPEPRVASSVSMTYIGRKLRREEVRSLVRSSDWSDTVRRRASEDNGRTWSEWELVYEEAPTQGQFTQSGA